MLLAGVLSAQGWEKVIGERQYHTARFVTQAQNGYIFVTGAEVDAAGSNVEDYIRLLNKDGDEMWKRTFPSPSASLISRVYETGDGSFIVYDDKQIEVNGELYHKHFIYKINLAGKTLWTYIVDVNSPINTFLRGLIIEGTETTFSYKAIDGSTIIESIDSEGNLLSSNVAEVPADNSYELFRINDQYVLRDLIIDTQEETNSWILYRLNLQGELVSSQSYSNLYTGDVGRITLLDNGDFVVVNHMPSPNNNGIKQTYVETATGATTVDTLWNSDQEFLGIFDLISDEDGITTLLYFPQISGVGLLKTSPEGEVLWLEVYDHHPASIFPYGLARGNDQGYLVVGEWQTPSLRNYIFKTDPQGRIYPNIISGNVAIDSTDNCLIDGGEEPLENWIVTAQNEENVFVGITDAFGSYSLPADVGTYSLSLARPNDYWEVCDNDVIIDFAEVDTFANLDFAVQKAIECPNIVLSQTTPTIRPCFERPSYINYCNLGTVDAPEAYIDITYDSLITPLSSSIPFDSLGGGVYRFQIGDLAPLECGEFVVNLFLDCDATVGAAYCMEAHAYPDSLCSPISSLWSGAYLEITSACENDSVKFKIENIGDGDMDDFSRYIIVEDVILQVVDSVNLDEGDFEDIKFEGNGSTFTMIAEQVEGAPGQSLPIGIVEGCGQNDNEEFSIGFSNQFPLNDADPYLDVDCPVAVSSYDPNDKRGFPLGYGDEHIIEPGTSIEYMIRFQNTGTDTAFTVIIRDSLTTDLDVSTFQAGASSHAYTYELRGTQELVFNFQNIMLPDSNVNEPASNGFVEFKISPRADLPLGTVIRNSAAIYFDFNEPIITDESFHTIKEDYLEFVVGTKDIHKANFLSVSIQPNPFSDATVIEVEDSTAQEYYLQIYDMQGRILRNVQQTNNKFTIRKGNLTSGIYFYRIYTSSNKVNAGKLIVH